jgi:transposase InsO family protein
VPSHRSPRRTPPDRVQAVTILRRLRFTAAEISQALRMPLSTVSAVLQRAGLGKLSRLAPPEPPNRYQRRHPGELVHIDVKKLARIDGAGHRVHGDRGRQTKRRGHTRIGYEYVHVCVDDATRLAYVEVLPDEKARSAVGFLRRARVWYRRHRVRIQRVMTDNGACYLSTLHALACRGLRIRHLRTRPRRPRTNGKAERFIRTLLAGWAYGAIYATSRERADALAGWVHAYNHTRPHGSLGHQPPIRRLQALTVNNVPGSYS